MTQSIWRLAVDLTCDNPRCVAHCLVESDGGRASIVWSYVYIEPSQIDPRAVVNGNRAEEGGEVLDAIGGDGEKYDEANDAEDLANNKNFCRKSVSDWFGLDVLRLPAHGECSYRRGRPRRRSTMIRRCIPEL
jgi:hypothetical protein